jgi:hypothetical protein
LFQGQDDDDNLETIGRLSARLADAAVGAEVAVISTYLGPSSVHALSAWSTGRVGIGAVTTAPAAHLHVANADGASLTPIIAERGETAAAALTSIDLRRNGASKGTIGLDASDRVVIAGGGGYFFEVDSSRLRLVSNSGTAVLELNNATVGARMTYGVTYVEANGTDVLLVSNGATKVYGGPLRYMDAARFQTTVGAAGGASALPATPTKYAKFMDDGGTLLGFPLYALS